MEEAESLANYALQIAQIFVRALAKQRLTVDDKMNAIHLCEHIIAKVKEL